MVELNLKVEVKDLEPVKQLIELLTEYQDELPEELRVKISELNH